MRLPTTALLALLAVLGSTMPAAASTSACVPAEVALACVADANGSAGSCDTQGYAYGYDSVFVVSPAAIVTFYAGHACYSGPGLTQEATSISAAAYTPVVAAQAEWSAVDQEDASGSYHFCTIQVVAGNFVTGWNTASAPCPVPPPNPGWGHLLP